MKDTGTRFLEPFGQDRWVQEALRKEQDRAQRYLDIVEVMVLAVDRQGAVTLINQKGCRVLGYREEEVLGKNWIETFVEPADREELNAVFGKLMAGELKAFEFHENPVVTRSGEKRLIAWHNAVLTDETGAPAGLLCSGEDITERRREHRKVMAYQKQLQVLASRLTLAEERERRRIAMGLHDRIGQALAVSRIKLGALRVSVADAGAMEAIDEVRGLISQSIQDIRTMTFELSPPTLYEVGFESAVEQLVRQLRDRHGISIEFEDCDRTKPLDNAMRTLLFYAVRELLLNIIKHANADRARVSIRRVEDNIRIEVEDNGVGADSARVEEAGGFGLFGVRERLKLMGGKFQFSSWPGRGTRVTLVAPLAKETGPVRGGKR